MLLLELVPGRGLVELCQCAVDDGKAQAGGELPPAGRRPGTFSKRPKIGVLCKFGR
jgi:hypothetical protein